MPPWLDKSYDHRKRAKKFAVKQWHIKKGPNKDGRGINSATNQVVYQDTTAVNARTQKGLIATAAPLPCYTG